MKATDTDARKRAKTRRALAKFVVDLCKAQGISLAMMLKEIQAQGEPQKR